MTTALTPSVPPLLLIYETLLQRKESSPKERQQYEQLLKGFIGEKKLRNILSSTDAGGIFPIFDLLLEINDTEFQIDCLLLTTDTIYLLEIKNFSGDYYLDNGSIFSMHTKRQIPNPLFQLERTSLLFNQLLEQLRVTMKVVPYIVFINNQFHLYGSSPKLPMIFPSQIARFLQRIISNSSMPSERIRRLALTLEKKRKGKSNHERLPDYRISELKKGIFCSHCNEELERAGKQRFRCKNCLIDYGIADVLLKAVAQYHLLFPEQNITTKNITDWCGLKLSENTVRRFLSKYLTINLNGSHTYYSFKEEKQHLYFLSRDYQSYGNSKNTN